MKRMVAMLILLALLFAFLPGCAGEPEPLRVCIDVSYSGGNDGEDPKKLQDIDDFMLSLKESGGLENVVIEVIPQNNPERSATITRLRTEIMSGGGPDVFIVESGFNSDVDRSLFPFPEKSMETGLFLPLDDYMENNTVFTEWDKQQPVVLAAGRNEEGQQIIPLAYTFPVQICFESDFVMKPRETLLTWQDTLTDSTLSEVYTEFNDCIDWSYVQDMQGNDILSCWIDPYLEHILGKLADFEQEELLFTEEELLLRVNEILALQEKSTHEDKSVFTNQFMGSSAVNSTIPITMMPMYSDDGGITASIRYFAAVNRNTEYPEDAYRVIDVLLRTHTQVNKPLYTDGFCVSGNTSLQSMPLYDETFHKDAPFNFRYFSDESFETFTQVKQQITAANFRSSLSDDLNMLLSECRNVGGQDKAAVEGLVHAIYESMQRKVRE